MPYTEFHYTPTGTGVISGKEVLEQTEDAINDLGGQISGDVQTAIDTANNALNTANTASADAQNAVNTANTAYTAATNAQNTANTAQNTASNALTAAQNAQNDVNALGNRVTTAENNISQNTSDISGLTTRMGTAEGNITTLQNDVITAQGTATSAQNTATLAREQAYVTRYTNTAVSDNSTVPYTDLNNIDNVKANDLLLDINGKLYQISSVDTANETVSVTTPLTQLAVDSSVIHNTGNETISGAKTFSDNVKVRNNDITRGSTTGSGYKAVAFTDSNDDELSRIAVNKVSNGSTSLEFKVSSTDNANTVISSSVQFFIAKGGTKVINPTITEDIALGRSSNKWSDVVTAKVNGVEPSSLSLPSGNVSDVIDISSYITDLSGSVNLYTVPANGYLTFTFSSGARVQIYPISGGGVSSSWSSGSSAGIIRGFMPVLKNTVLKIVINATTMDSFYFIPCQGNV